MPTKKTHPGLDEVVTDAEVDRFITGDTEPTFIEAPERRWPVTAFGAVVAATVGVLAGFAVAPFLSVLQLFIIIGLGVGTAAAILTVELGDDGG